MRGRGKFSLNTLKGDGEGRSQNSGLGISSGGGGSSGPQVLPIPPQNWPSDYERETWALPVPAKSTLNAQTLLSVSRPRLTPLAAVPANPLGHRPPRPFAQP